MIEHVKKLMTISDQDELIHGESMIEFGERSIKIRDPKKLENMSQDKKLEVFANHMCGIKINKELESNGVGLKIPL